MDKAEQEKQAEVTARARLLSFDCGVESAVRAMGLDKEAVVKQAGSHDFREFTEWTLDYASALAEQAQTEQARTEKPAEAK